MKMKVSCVVFLYFVTFITHSFGAGILPDRVRDFIDENFDVEDTIAELREQLEALAASLEEVSLLSTEVENLKSSLSGLTETVQSIGEAVLHLDQKDKEQDAAIAELDAEDPIIVDSPVAFYATLKKKTTFEDGETVIFDNVITNFGNKYSDKCGTFRAPVHGLYFFNLFFIGISKPAPSTNLDIMVNHVRQCVAYADFANRHETGTCSIMVELREGDTVHVEHEDPHNDGGAAWNGPYTGFSGFLYQSL